MKIQGHFKLFFFISHFTALVIFILTQMGTKPLTSIAELNNVKESFVLHCVWGINRKLPNSLGKKMTVGVVAVGVGAGLWRANWNPHKRKVDVYLQVNVGLNVTLKYNVLFWLLCLKKDTAVKKTKWKWLQIQKGHTKKIKAVLVGRPKNSAMQRQKIIQEWKSKRHLNTHSLSFYFI